ncbi:MAG TPA: alpha/beta hydrolase, partial [Proteobacteria bacterium]|nr:alpha/beta hydrolase [Pseudomonadota bacterium]
CILLNPQFARREDIEPLLVHLAETDCELLARLLLAFERHSGRNVLAELDVPVLVVAGEADPFTPAEHYEEICKLASDCDILWLRRGSHAVLLEQPEVVNLRVEKFLQESVEFQ